MRKLEQKGEKGRNSVVYLSKVAALVTAKHVAGRCLNVNEGPHLLLLRGHASWASLHAVSWGGPRACTLCKPGLVRKNLSAPPWGTFYFPCIWPHQRELNALI